LGNPNFSIIFRVDQGVAKKLPPIHPGEILREEFRTVPLPA
jgi:hypothetical protein